LWFGDGAHIAELVACGLGIAAALDDAILMPSRLDGAHVYTCEREDRGESPAGPRGLHGDPGSSDAKPRFDAR
jgi:hypothetical protein